MRPRSLIATAAAVLLMSAGQTVVATPAQAIPVGCENPGPGEIVFLGDGDDLYLGTPGADIIFGGAGDDIIDGNGGGDVLVGGPGHDILLGSACGDRLFGNHGSDKLGGRSGNDVLDGGEGDDYCSDNAYPDIVYFSNFLPC
ncbi:calcium-binding protein [Phytohabitans rumicis]|nr:hypothetical protein [Phytohabitans rumicis]